MRDVYEQLEAAGLSDRVAYGLVGFRSNTTAVPALEYVSRKFSDLTTDGKTFLDQVARISIPSSTPTPPCAATPRASCRSA